MNKRLIIIIFSVLACFSKTTIANDSAALTIKLTDSASLDVSDGVFIFEPQFQVDAKYIPKQPPAVMNQINKQFVPHVLVVKAGTDISFPNADNLFHHVYSFSPAKQFELKLYKEFNAEPLRFDSAGVVDIGCNIHDWMLGYIVVSDSPFFGKTDASGMVSVQLPKGEYRVRFWHPLIDGEKALPAQRLSITETSTVTWQLNQSIPVDDGFDSGFGDY